MSLVVSIVGRGFAGLALAYRFAKAGAQVRLIGPARLEGSASHCAIGVSSLKGCYAPHNPWFSAKIMGHQNLPHWIAELEKDTGEEIPHRFDGVCEPFNSLGEADEIFTRLNKDELPPPDPAKRILAKDFPQTPGLERLSEGSLAGVFSYQGDGWVDAPRLLKVLEIAARQFGVEFSEKIVRSILPDAAGGLRIAFDEGFILSDEVILAAGAFSEEILRSSGFSALKIRTASGQVLNLPLKMGDYFAGVKKKHSFLIRKNDLRFGSTTFKEAVLSESDKIQGQTQLKEALNDAFGRVVPAEAASFDWGVRVRLKDWVPAVGDLFYPNEGKRLLLAMGYYKNGCQLADLSARFLVSHVMKQGIDPNLSAVYQHFAPMRFQ